jgi:hypothetical protein
MGYDIRAFIAKSGTFDEIKLLSHCVTVVPLNQGFELLLNDWGFRETALNPKDVLQEDEEGFDHLTLKQVAIMLPLSFKTPIAYVEADFAGGGGEQRAVVWHNGKIVLLPETNSVFGGIPDAGGAINMALRFIGVQPQPPWDEFSSSGIGKHRHLEDWFEKYNTSPNKKDCEAPGN